MKATFIALTIICLWVTSAIGETTYSSVEPPPITKVTLYKHGMGYLEREGKIKGNVMLNLAFRADQMKDILTSFFAVDLGRGKVTSVKYETRDPLSKQLEDILIKVPEGAALSQFMSELKGARLSVKVAGENIEGRILGIEPINEVIGNQNIKKSYRLVLLTGPGSIRSLDLFDISEISLADESLRGDLRRLLDISLDSKYTNRKKLTVTSVGEGERDFRIGYLMEMPIWKCSYRVIFDEKGKDSSALLQAWALAENNTEEDWEDITISFVAGNPISYVMDLYSPYYVRRAQVPIPGFQGLSVDWSAVSPPDLAREEASFGQKQIIQKKARQQDRKLAMTPRAGGRAPGAQTIDPASPAERSAMDSRTGKIDREDSRAFGELLADSYDSDTLASKIGDLFSYEPKEKISIPRGQAAMVPILSKKIDGRRILYYKAAFAPKAVNAFALQNVTDLTLEAGPVTFFDGGASLGEGILSHTLPPGSQEVIPYAIDVSVDIVEQEKTRKDPHFKARLVDGILTLTSVETLTNSWKIVNRAKEPATLWLHQPKNTGYRLSKPEKPLKEVDNHYRFELPLKAGETVDFVVEQKRDVQETTNVGKCSEEQIRFYISQPNLSKGARAFLKDLSDLMAKKAGAQREITERTQQSKRLAEEQERIRSNLQALVSNQPKEQELRAKWVTALAANEEKLTENRAKLDDAGAQLHKIEDSLARKVRDYKDE